MLKKCLHWLETQVGCSNKKLIHSEAKKYIPKEGNLLDVGCRGGATGSIFYPHYKLTGIDLVKDFLEIAKKKNCYSQLYRMDASNLKFKDNSFDVVLITEVLEHLPPTKIQKAFSELYRVSKNYIIITVPNYDHFLQKFLHVFFFHTGLIRKKDLRYHHQKFTQHILERYVKNAGFKVLSSQKIIDKFSLLLIAEK